MYVLTLIRGVAQKWTCCPGPLEILILFLLPQTYSLVN